MRPFVPPSDSANYNTLVRPVLIELENVVYMNSKTEQPIFSKNVRNQVIGPPAI